MLNLSQLQTFVTVMSEGSMTAAADKLYLTQPAVSQQIRNLEEELGVDLLVRGVRVIKATAQGEVLFEHAKRILLQVQQAEVAVKSMGSELKGSVRIGTLNSIGLQIMSPVLSRLLRFNPQLHLKVDYERGEELVRKFQQKEIDVIILPETLKEFGVDLGLVERKVLLKEEMWLVGTGKDTNVPLQIDDKDLSKFPYVQFSGEYPGFQRNFRMRLQELGLKLNVVFESANVGTLKRVIETGLGWGFLPAHSVKKQIRSGRLVRTHLKSFHYDVDLIYYYRADSENKALVETLYHAMSQQEKS